MKIEMSDNAMVSFAWFVVFLLVVLFAKEPDLLDALITRIQR